MQLSSAYRKHERIKKRAYEQISNMPAQVTPLVVSATEGLGNEAKTFYKRLASLLASKWDNPYNKTMCWLRCRLSFSLLSSDMSIRGARSSCGHAVRTPTEVDLIIRVELLYRLKRP